MIMFKMVLFVRIAVIQILCSVIKMFTNVYKVHAGI
jgi:hypothetical protein